MAGVITIDHRRGQGLDGAKGTLEQYEAVSCVHCQAVIAVLRRGTSQYDLSQCDVLRATGRAPSLSSQFVGRFTCTACRGHVHPFTGERQGGAICRACAAELEVTKHCPGPWDAKEERFLSDKPAGGGWATPVPAS
jgi:isopentenyldiphosphate isomerase